MEFKSVFNAARDGKLYRLKVFLEHKPKERVAMLLSLQRNGASPLVIACRNGHADVVLYLIQNCHADVEQVGSVLFDGETIDGAPPLWCASAAGHLNIVKILVLYEASVNSTTETNSTPLRAACYDGHFEIAKYLIQNGADIEIANRHGHTSLMIACYKGHYEIAKYLLSCGADVNRTSVKGNTALHDSAESGSLEILKLVLEHGATMEIDHCGCTPLVSAAVAGHVEIVEYFIHEFGCTKEEKVNALELLGATFLDKKRDMTMALDCWRQAMQLRYEDSEFPLEKPTIQSPLEAYVNATEFRTFGQLEEIISDPDKMRMQALLVRERILGSSHADSVYYIRYRGATYADNGNYNRCIQLWMYALDVQQKVRKPLSPVTQSCLVSFAELFSCMMSEASSFPVEFPVVPFQDMLHVFARTLKEIETAKELFEKQVQDLDYINKFHRTLIIAMNLVGLMCRLQPHLIKSEELELKKAVYQLVRMNPRATNGWTLLHFACSKDSPSLGQFPVLSFPSPEVVDLLLEVGACPNAVDGSDNTPLHITAMNKPCSEAIFKSLLNHGAHLDLCNYEKDTPLQLAQDTVLDIYPLQFINLQCLSAQVVRTHNIPYKGFVDKRLEAFLDKH